MPSNRAPFIRFDPRCRHNVVPSTGLRSRRTKRIKVGGYGRRAVPPIDPSFGCAFDGGLKSARILRICHLLVII